MITQKKVLITRSLKDLNKSSISFESRFLQRFKTLLKTIFADSDESKLKCNAKFSNDAYVNFPLEKQTLTRPTVKVNFVELFKKTKLSATNFETLQKNPYDFYCYKYLKLKDISFISLDGIDTIKGSLTHKIFELYSCNPEKYSNMDELKNLIQRIMNKYVLSDKKINCILYENEINSIGLCVSYGSKIMKFFIGKRHKRKTN